MWEGEFPPFSPWLAGERFGPSLGWTPPPLWFGPSSPTIVVESQRSYWDEFSPSGCPMWRVPRASMERDFLRKTLERAQGKNFGTTGRCTTYLAYWVWGSVYVSRCVDLVCFVLFHCFVLCLYALSLCLVYVCLVLWWFIYSAVVVKLEVGKLWILWSNRPWRDATQCEATQHKASRLCKAVLAIFHYVISYSHI